jgi:hypothetical protein
VEMLARHWLKEPTSAFSQLVGRIQLGFVYLKVVGTLGARWLRKWF